MKSTVFRDVTLCSSLVLVYRRFEGMYCLHLQGQVITKANKQPMEAEIFLFSTTSISALGLNQPPVQCVPAAPSLGVKRPRREADHSPTSSVKVKNICSYNIVFRLASISVQ
jgi:hypothetical protein